MRTKKYLAVKKSGTHRDVYFVEVINGYGTCVRWSAVKDDAEADKFIEFFKGTRFKWPWQKVEVTVVYA